MSNRRAQGDSQLMLKIKENHILPQRAQGIRYGKLIFSRGSCKRAHDVFIFSG